MSFRRRPRRRWPVSKTVIRLLAPIYRRSVSRSELDSDRSTVYVLRGIGTHGVGPVLTTKSRVPADHNGLGSSDDLHIRKPPARV